MWIIIKSQAGTVKISMCSWIRALKQGKGKILSNQGLAKTKATMPKLQDDHLQPKEPDGFCLFVSIEGNPT